MDARFSKHYTLEEARALLPRVRQWLDELGLLQERLKTLDKRVGSLLAAGDDVGGPSVNQLIRTLGECKEILRRFRSHEIQIKDLDRGLIDFPSLRDGREVFLCWEKDEDDIEFWHDLESGYPGRERVSPERRPEDGAVKVRRRSGKVERVAARGACPMTRGG